MPFLWVKRDALQAKARRIVRFCCFDSLAREIKKISTQLIILFITAMLGIPQTAHESGNIVEIKSETRESVSRPLLASAKAPPIPAVLERIAFCESNGDHYDDTAQAKRGKRNRKDIGKYQINVEYWGKEAEKLGYDVYTEEGNEAMALELYRRYGTKPWVWSKNCWAKS